MKVASVQFFPDGTIVFEMQVEGHVRRNGMETVTHLVLPPTELTEAGDALRNMAAHVARSAYEVFERSEPGVPDGRSEDGWDVDPDVQGPYDNPEDFA